MAQVEFKTYGIDDVVGMFEKLSNKTECETMFVATVKAGANVVADYMREQIKALKTTKSYKKGKRSDKRYCTENEKRGLLESMGWAPVDERYGVYDSNIGFDGYNEYIKSDTRHPNALVANTINRGSSYQMKQPFISRTRNAGMKQAEEKMREEFEKEINRRTR